MLVRAAYSNQNTTVVKSSGIINNDMIRIDTLKYDPFDENFPIVKSSVFGKLRNEFDGALGCKVPMICKADIFDIGKVDEFKIYKTSDINNSPLSQKDEYSMMNIDLNNFVTRKGLKNNLDFGTLSEKYAYEDIFNTGFSEFIGIPCMLLTKVNEMVPIEASAVITPKKVIFRRIAILFEDSKNIERSKKDIVELQKIFLLIHENLKRICQKDKHEFQIFVAVAPFDLSIQFYDPQTKTSAKRHFNISDTKRIIYGSFGTELASGRNGYMEQALEDAKYSYALDEVNEFDNVHFSEYYTDTPIITSRDESIFAYGKMLETGNAYGSLAPKIYAKRNYVVEEK